MKRRRTKKVELKPTLDNTIQRKKLASATMKNAFRIGNKVIAYVPVELLNIKEYQRSRQVHVMQIAENWDDAKCNVLLVSYDTENGCFNVMDAQALCNAQMNLQTAYNNFFKRPEVGFPKFKSKKNHHYSYTTNQVTIRVSVKYITLPKVGQVKIKRHRTFEGRIKNATVSQMPSGKYYVSVLVDQGEKEKLPLSETTLGIDLGIKEFAITSDGEMIENPKYLRKSEKRLRKLQKDLSRCQSGSKNRKKCRIKVAKQHEKIANQRKDFLHKLSKQIIDENQVIVLETLKVKNMMSNHKLAKSIADVS